MNRNNLEGYLGRLVEIKLFDDVIITGCLRKTGEEAFKHNPDLYLRKNFYFLTQNINSTVCKTCLFRVSHIKSIKVLKQR